MLRDGFVTHHQIGFATLFNFVCPFSDDRTQNLRSLPIIHNPSILEEYRHKGSDIIAFGLCPDESE